ncbi:two-component system, OmpR family, phosphate regulon response regulator OmpR [Burkholderia sp. D7]|nr:two-component system, OmpR family, phosphate regulon response regulator OmpR [Burkholderia sp. D7]
MKQLILVVDGDASCRDALRTTLQASGYDVAVLYNASKVVRRIETERPTLMVMAGGASSGDGLAALQALQALRTSQDDLPIIMLGEQRDETERIIALECGADDVISKPFNVQEVLVRIRNVLKRVQRHRLQDPVWRAPYEFNGFRLDFAWRSLTYHGEPVQLTQNEYAILALLVTAPGRVFSKAAIVQCIAANAPDAQGDAGVWVHRLRSRIKRVAGVCEIIETVRGKGYAFNLDPGRTHRTAFQNVRLDVLPPQTATRGSAG